MEDLTDWLLGAVAAGFVGWSIVVIRAIATVQVLASKLVSMEDSLKLVESNLKEHEGLDWHSEAGTRIRIIERRIDFLEGAADIDHHND